MSVMPELGEVNAKTFRYYMGGSCGHTKLVLSIVEGQFALDFSDNWYGKKGGAEKVTLSGYVSSAEGPRTLLIADKDAGTLQLTELDSDHEFTLEDRETTGLVMQSEGSVNNSRKTGKATYNALLDVRLKKEIGREAWAAVVEGSDLKGVMV